MLEDWDWGLDSLRNALAANFSVSLEIPLKDSESTATSAPWVQRAAEITANAIAEAVSGSYTLVGACFGANVALWQALTASQQVEALVLISSSSVRPLEPPHSCTPQEAIAQLTAHWEQVQYLPKQVTEMAAQYLAQLGNAGAFLHDAAAEVRLGEIQCSTLVIFGTEDRLVSAQAGSVYPREIPICNLGYGLRCRTPDHSRPAGGIDRSGGGLY